MLAKIKNKFLLLILLQCFFCSFAPVDCKVISYPESIVRDLGFDRSKSGSNIDPDFPYNPPVKSSKKQDIAMCAIFQNEAPYLKEWIEFHKLVGVKKFYLFNNLSSDHFQEVLDPYIKSGIVKLINWPYKPTKSKGWDIIQCEAYNYATRLTKKKFRWLAVLDVDEFLFPLQVDTLNEFLEDYKDFAGVVVNWQMYGTSHVESTIAVGLPMIEQLILKASSDYNENIHIKSIVRPDRIKYFESAHHAKFKSGFYSVNSNCDIISGPFSSPVRIDKIRINHYWARDEDFFRRVKLPRRQKWLDGAALERSNNLNAEIDEAILKYVPELKKSL